MPPRFKSACRKSPCSLNRCAWADRVSPLFVIPRDVALDAHHGSFTTGEVFFADGKFGSQANFDRVDLSDATYYDFGLRHWVFARQTRYGQERYSVMEMNSCSLSRSGSMPGAPPRIAALVSIPLGRAIRRPAFPLAEPAFVNTLELRPPPPTLRWVGTDLGFVLFYDMGNAFEVFPVWPAPAAHQAARTVIPAAT